MSVSGPHPRAARKAVTASSGSAPRSTRTQEQNVPVRPHPPAQWTTTRSPSRRRLATSSARTRNASQLLVGGEADDPVDAVLGELRPQQRDRRAQGRAGHPAGEQRAGDAGGQWDAGEAVQRTRTSTEPAGDFDVAPAGRTSTVTEG
jgi:hypothetical protein